MCRIWCRYAHLERARAMLSEAMRATRDLEATFQVYLVESQLPHEIGNLLCTITV